MSITPKLELKRTKHYLWGQFTIDQSKHLYIELPICEFDAEAGNPDAIRQMEHFRTFCAMRRLTQ